MANTPNIASPFGGLQGRVTLQPHVGVPEGLYEEEHARQGFFGRTSHLYHRHPPTGWLRIEGDLKPRAYQAVQLDGEAHFRARFFLENSDVRIGIAKLTGEMKVFARNADGDGSTNADDDR
jgi:homogentisate 1,2-dioxygenase